MAELKFSRQRAALLAELRSRRDHPTADMLYQAVRTKYPKVSLGTIYRNLALLCEIGEIKKIPCIDGSERYDGFTHPHDHFVCRKCGKVIDMESEGKDFDKKVKNKDIGCVEDYSLIYYGLCRECKNNNK